MSLVYRSIWQDDREGLCEGAFATLRTWIEEKYDSQIEVPRSGRSEAEIPMGGASCAVDLMVEEARAEGGPITALRAALAETRSDNVRWQTTLRAWDDRSGITRDSYLWIDVSVVGDDVDLRTMSPAAPRLARGLIAAGRLPRVGTNLLTTSPQMYFGAEAGEELAEIVSDFNRTLPVVVFSRDDARFTVFGSEDYSFDDLVTRVAHRTAGIASVAIIDSFATAVFTSALGESHGVWNGAFRVYLSNVDPAASNDAWRHRYVTADRYMGRRDTAATIVSRILKSVTPTRRPPESFKRAKALLDDVRTGKRDIESLTAYADSEIERHAREVIELRQRVGDLELQLDGAALDQQIAQEELASSIDLAEQLQRQVAYYMSLLQSTGRADEFENSAESVSNIPSSASNSTDAAVKARHYFADRITIPDKALVDLEKLDTAPNAAAWGQEAWRAFRALHTYASSLDTASDDKGFMYWCKYSRHPFAWPSSKLAMKESDTIGSNSKSRKQRTFPVSNEVSQDGQIYMEAHMKIALSGNSLIPRLYFWIDHENASIHVGYFGPHQNIKNSRS